MYYVNLQTEVKRKVLLDVEYLSFRWTGGFDFNRNANGLNGPINNMNMNSMNNINNNNNNVNYFNNMDNNMNMDSNLF